MMLVHNYIRIFYQLWVGSSGLNKKYPLLLLTCLEGGHAPIWIVPLHKYKCTSSCTHTTQYNLASTFYSHSQILGQVHPNRKQKLAKQPVFSIQSNYSYLSLKNTSAKWHHFNCISSFNISRNHVVLTSFVFVIGPTERSVLASYTMVVSARLHDQCIGANSQSEFVIPNWFNNWFSLYTVHHAHSYS